MPETVIMMSPHLQIRSWNHVQGGEGHSVQSRAATGSRPHQSAAGDIHWMAGCEPTTLPQLHPAAMAWLYGCT